MNELGRNARRIIRVGALLGSNAVLAGSLCVAFVPTWMLGPARGMRARAGLRRRWVRLWGRITLRILSVRVEAQGRAPRAPFLLVSNHLGYLDVPLLASQVGSVFVSKAEIRSWPLVGPLATLGGTVYVQRESARDAVRALAAMGEAHRRGDGVVLFPEGTSSAGDGILPLRAALLEGAVREGREVHHVTVQYRTRGDDPPARDTVAWWGDTEFAGHFWRLCGLRIIEARLRFGERAHRAADRRALAASLQAALEEGFQAMDRDHE